MGAITKIEWCDRTFNPWIGCTKVSEGCLNCYAEDQMANRWKKCGWGPQSPRVRTSKANWRKPLLWERVSPRFMECAVCKGREARGWDGYAYKNCTNHDCLSLSETESRRVRQRVFCASLADWLDDAVPIEWLADLLALIMATPHLDWLLLTKRPELWGKRIEGVLQWIEGHADWEINIKHHLLALRNWLADWFVLGIPPRNVWLGTSVENQEQANRRIPHLLRIPAVVRFLSCEPLLGPINLRRIVLQKSNNPDRSQPDISFDALQGWMGGTDQDRSLIHWVIAGGESGRRARPMHPDWTLSLLDQCQAANVQFFFKQWGEWRPVVASDFTNPFIIDSTPTGLLKQNGKLIRPYSWKDAPGTQMIRVGKKRAGRLLAGREWNEFPEVKEAA
jgi:protein gp37